MENITTANGLIPLPASDEATTVQEPKQPKKRSRAAEKEAHDSDLEWFLTCGDAAMGEHGTLGGTIAVLEHGGQFTGVPSSDLYSDQHVGWKTTVVGLVEKHRWLSAAWFALDSETQVVLLACYRAPDAQLRSDEGFSGRDACPRAEDIERNRAIEPQKGTALHNRRGTEAALGRYAALTFWLCEDPAALLRACQDPRKGKSPRTISKALGLARERAIAAHASWQATKELVPGPRSRRERVAALPEHEPSESAL
jgi:hypothetical protein